MAYKVIQVGCGGHGGSWCARFLPPNIADGLVEPVAAVDLSPDALKNAQENLKLPSERCFTDVKKAFAAVKADFCVIVVPPAYHEAVVDIAVAHGVHILSEKPIADTLLASCRIALKVKRAGLKMGVTMSHRFDQDKTTLRNELRSGKYGDLDYLVSRFTCDARKFGVWGKFRHEIADTLMIEGAVHHLDILADLAGKKCQTLYARTWKPKWGEYKGDCQALVTMDFGKSGPRAFYEGAKTNAVGLNGWTQEYIRAECEKATFVLSRRRVEAFDHDASKSWTFVEEGKGREIPLLQQPKWANTWLIEQFVKWLDGGPKMETNVEANLQSMALVEAGIISSRSNEPVHVQVLLDEVMHQAQAELTPKASKAKAKPAPKKAVKAKAPSKKKRK